jgi:hypothetical protein
MVSELEQWLTTNKLCFTAAGGTCLIFNPPPELEHAHGAAIMPPDARGKHAAKLLRTFGWATRAARGDADAVRWLTSLGYGRGAGNRPGLRVPHGKAIYGSSKLDLVVVAGHVVTNPAITSRAMAERLSEESGRAVHYQQADRAMIAVGWGPEERSAFRRGEIGAPVVVAE